MNFLEFLQKNFHFWVAAILKAMAAILKILKSDGTSTYDAS